MNSCFTINPAALFFCHLCAIRRISSKAGLSGEIAFCLINGGENNIVENMIAWEKIGIVMNRMIEYSAGDVKRINHFLKVYGFAKGIGEVEGLGPEQQNILEIAALTHDIGIKKSMAVYGSAAGKYQEIEGPPEARTMLSDLGCDSDIIERVCWLIAHHHTYDPIQGIDHQILVEADFLVNIYEGNLHGPDGVSVSGLRANMFRTAAGIHLLDCLYGTDAD
jgi:hypothetical protein